MYYDNKYNLKQKCILFISLVFIVISIFTQINDFNSNRVRVVYQDYYKILGGEGKDIMIYNDVVDESDIDLLIDKYNEDIYKTTFDTYNTNDRDLYVIKYNCNTLKRRNGEKLSGRKHFNFS